MKMGKGQGVGIEWVYAKWQAQCHTICDRICEKGSYTRIQICKFKDV